MIYDDKTLEDMELSNLRNHEEQLLDEFQTYQKYWLRSYNDNDVWAHKLTRVIECLKQVRKFIKKYELEGADVEPPRTDELIEVTIIDAPITDRRWEEGQKAFVRNGRIRIDGDWFDLDDRWELVKERKGSDITFPTITDMYDAGVEKGYLPKTDEHSSFIKGASWMRAFIRRQINGNEEIRRMNQDENENELNETQKLDNRKQFINDWAEQIGYWAQENPDASLELLVSKLMDAALNYKDELDIDYDQGYEL